MAAGGELAIDVGILPYESKEAFEAVGDCFKAWLRERGSLKMRWFRLSRQFFRSV